MFKVCFFFENVDHCFVEINLFRLKVWEPVISEQLDERMKYNRVN